MYVYKQSLIIFEHVVLFWSRVKADWTHFWVEVVEVVELEAEEDEVLLSNALLHQRSRRVEPPARKNHTLDGFLNHICTRKIKK